MKKKKKNHPDVFSTGEAARICRISQQTIIRCFDNGQLKGFKVPGSKFRRILLRELKKFMENNGMPTDLLPVINEVGKNGKTA